MADIRINSLPTTASASSSDDFLALDGATNGTRKLNAFSPTFGGNLTVSGTGTSSFAGVAQFAATKGVTFNTSTDVGAYGIGFKNDGSKFPIRVSLVNDSGTPRYFQVGYYSNDTQAGTWTNSFEVNAQNGNATLAGNLTVSGTGTSTFAGPVTLSNTASTASYQTGLRLSSTVASAPNTVQSLEFYSSSLGVALAAVDALRESGSYASSLRFWSTTGPGVLTENMRLTSGGNVLIGTTTNSANGKLQLATHTTSAGGIGFGTDTPLYRSSQGVLNIEANYNGSTWLRMKNTDTGAGAAAGVLFANQSGDYGAISILSSGATPANALLIRTLSTNSLILRTNGNDALTLDSSQNAIFAKDVRVQAATSALTWFKDSTPTKAWGIGSNGWAGLSGGDGSMIFGVYNGSAWSKALELDNATQSATFAGTVKVNNQGIIKSGGVVVVGTSATTIFTISGTAGANFCFVCGDNGSHGFADLVVTIGGGNAVTVISSATLYGSPAARTYTTTGTSLQLALASGTLSVRTTEIYTA